MTGCDDHPPGVTGQVRGAVVPQHLTRVGGVQDLQADPQGGVGADGGGDHPAGALGGQDQVDAQAPALRGHPDQGVQDVGVLAGQGGELVHDHQEPGQDGPRRQARDVLGPGPGQDPLASAHLRLQGGQGPGGVRRVQVGEDPGGVRQAA